MLANTSLRLQSLRVLSITAADCTEGDLATLFLNHKDTLREIHLDSIDIIEGKGSWTSLECTVEEKLSIEKFSHVNTGRLQEEGGWNGPARSRTT